MQTTVSTVPSVSETAPTVPAAFRPAAPDAPCETYAWCRLVGEHDDHFGREVGLREPVFDRPVLSGFLFATGDDGELLLPFAYAGDAFADFTSGDELRAETTKVRAHLARLDALADQYDAVCEAAGGQPEPSGREWTITTVNEAVVRGYLPAWAENDPSQEGIRADRLQLNLADLCHYRYYPGQPLSVLAPGQATDSGGVELVEQEAFIASVNCNPHSDEPGVRIPHVNVQVFDGFCIEGLDPAGVAGLADKLRAQAAVLDRVAADLTAARADWAKNGGAK